MTYLEVSYRYASSPSENAIRALDGVREVYGVLQIQFNQQERTVRVRFDASRLKDAAVANLLRRAGLDILDRMGVT